ncbi:MAG: amino acid ABC transporter substrate-binding protein [Gammaproteobacteria bacterium]|nr:amino acid ABC transporter substrate-binding protein [Gammaproteobacteria bacterium]
MSKNFFLKIAVLITLLLANSSVVARNLILLAFPEEPSKYEENGEIKGIDVEIIDRVMKQLGIGYEIHLVESNARILKQAKLGEADIIFLFSKNDARLDYLTYPKESYRNLVWNFFIRKEDQGEIHYETFADFENLIVGATKNVAYTPDFWNANLNLEIVAHDRLQLPKLLKKRIDVVPRNTIQTLYEEGKSGNIEQLAYLPRSFKNEPYYFAFSKASDYPNMNEIIKRYDEIIKTMKEDGTILKIMEKYLGEKLLRIHQHALDGTEIPVLYQLDRYNARHLRQVVKDWFKSISQTMSGNP